MKGMTAGQIAQITGGRILCGSSDSSVSEVCTDSRKAGRGTLFVPIVGANVDAHDFIPAAIAQGAAAVFTSRQKTEDEAGLLPDGAALIAVEDTRAALQDLGRWYRALFPQIPVIGITGSVGKTTTKEMVAAALETELTVLKTAGNMNSQVGLPQMMLRMAEGQEAAVIEMGMSEPGEMARLTKIAKPVAAVMTNIGVSHIGQFGSKELIRWEKLNIINSFGENSVLFVNGDDELLKALIDTPSCVGMSEESRQALKKARVEGFGTAGDLTYRAEAIRFEDNRTCFTYVGKNGAREEIVLQVLGMHNVYNALAALAAAEYLGIPAARAKVGLASYLPAAMRGRMEDLGGLKLLDDTYNASPDSIKGCIDMLMGISGVKRTVAVLADILELGQRSGQYHYEVGASIAARTKAPDYVITVGREAARIAEAVKDSGKEIRTAQFAANEEAAAYLMTLLKPGDAVAVKGSRGMKTEEIADALRNKFGGLSG